MKKSVSFLSSIILGIFSFLLLFPSCEVGMGASVDLEAPVITVQKMQSGETSFTSNFETSIYCHKDVIFYGTAEDNEKLTKVRVDVKWSNDDDYVFLKDAALTGKEWTADLSLENEGACSLKFTAEDRSGNYSIKSSKIVTLFVDNNAPVGDSWYIDRLNNGIQYSLQSLSALKNIIAKDKKLTQPANIDVAQNVEFDICSAFSDASGINSVSISIYDESGNKVLGNIHNSAGSNYAPRFKIKHEDLVNAKPALAQGLHYLQVRYSAQDTVTDPGANAVTDEALSLGWFVWWPQSDNPKYSISGIEEDSNGNPYLKLNIGDSLSVTIFDDDALRGTINCALKVKDVASHVDNTSASADVNVNERERVLILTAPTTPHDMELTMTAEAKSGAPLNVTIPVKVSDETLPTLILTAPAHNQIPSVTGVEKNINFTGLTLDKSDCKYLDFIWVPSTVDDKRTKATEWFNSIASTNNGHDSYNPGNNAVKCRNVEDVDPNNLTGMKLWSAKLTDVQNDGSGFKKKTFNFNLSLINDFDDQEKAQDKYFLVRLTREDGKYSETELKLSADNLKPEILHTTPAGNMAIIDKDEDFTISFTVQKQSGLPLSEVKLYHVPKEYDDENPSLHPLELITITPSAQPNSLGEYASGTTFTSALISDADGTNVLAGYAQDNENPIYRFYAKDILGNKRTEDLQFIISSKPAIKSITSSAPEKNKKGDEILINVSFTKAVTIGTDVPKLELTGISNSDSSKTFYADFESSSNGSTTLVFKYTVGEGDYSTGLGVVNGADGPLVLTNYVSFGAHLNLDDDNNLQKKREADPITIDGRTPVVESIEVKTEVGSDNIVDGVTYLRTGRKITAKVKVSKNVTVQGAPVFNLKRGNSIIPLVWQSIETEDNKPVLVFSKKVVDDDENGSVKFDKNDCIVNIGTVKDDFDNELKNPLTGDGGINWYIDTHAPLQPVVKKFDDSADLEDGYYQNSLSFLIKYSQTDENTDKSLETIQYSTNGGTNWTDYAEFTDPPANTNRTIVELTSTDNPDSMLTARIKDRAGNVSPYTNTLDIKINSTFPDFTLECTNPDGNYKTQTTLTFKVYFSAPVNIPASSGNSRPYVDLGNDRKAYITPTTAQTKVSEATFTYKTTNTDDFTVSVAETGVHLTGVKDEFDFAQGNKPLASAYNRPNLHCDSVAPLVTKMEIDGSSNNTNVYDSTKARKITLTFSENVELGTGKLYLRQVAGWAIPPVLTASEFSTICNLNPDGKEILSVQENGNDMEDSAWDGSTTQTQDNAGYHGTGQYVGPYKKSTQGVKDDGTPDISTKYVLDFDMDIWETNTEHYYNKTFVPRTNKANETYAAPRTNSRTADQIRAELEKVHYHERYMSVTSASINDNVVTLTFPAGLFGDTDLPNGRKWELVIEKESFMDLTGNKFGAEPDGTIKQKDAVQTATGTSGSQSEDFDTWTRGRSTLEEDETPVVLIKNNTNEYFWSDKAATPVIRVDRYSYGNGIFQSNNNAVESQIAAGGETIPTAWVRVRIDCETEGAAITYNYTGTPNSITTAPTYNANNDHHLKDNADGRSTDSYSYVTNTASVLGTINLTGTGIHTGTIDKTHKIIFAYGNGDYTKSFKGYVKAIANKNGDSGVGREGVFQTVVRIVDPTQGANTHYYDHTEVFSIRGTTGMKGEPTISPFPLRDNQFFTPFIRHTYRERRHKNNSTSFYWISYEVLVQSSFSGHSSYNDQWIAQWGKMYPGEFTYCTGFRSW